MTGDNFIADIYRMAYESGYFNGRIDETLGKEYDDRTPLTKRREAVDNEEEAA